MPRKTLIVESDAYQGAKTRCTKPRHPAYKNYGGRGIQFRFKSFAEFLAHVGTRPSPEYTLDRIDNTGHYETGNVRWALWTEQASNRRPRARKGYYSHTGTQRWMVLFKHKGRKVFGGNHSTEEEAKVAYAKKLEELQ